MAQAFLICRLYPQKGNVRLVLMRKKKKESSSAFLQILKAFFLFLKKLNMSTGSFNGQWMELRRQKNCRGMKCRSFWRMDTAPSLPGNHYTGVMTGWTLCSRVWII